MRYTFRELRNEKINNIPTSSGIYWVLMPETFCLKYMKETDGPAYGKKGTKMAYPVHKLEEWGAHYSKADRGGNILYIGKAKNLQNRIQQYLEFGYNDEKYMVHEGGRAIWQLENNKDLLVKYQVCENEVKIETELIDKYILKYGSKPFANRRRGLKKYRLF